MKTYKNYIKNQKLRRENPNIRQIKNGRVSKLHSERNVERPISAF